MAGSAPCTVRKMYSINDNTLALHCFSSPTGRALYFRHQSPRAKSTKAFLAVWIAWEQNETKYYD